MNGDKIWFVVASTISITQKGSLITTSCSSLCTPRTQWFWDLTIGAFHDNSTSAQHPTTWDFLENWYKGYSSAQKPKLTILDSSEQWFTNNSIGHFCIVVLQYHLLGTFTLISPKPREKKIYCYLPDGIRTFLVKSNILIFDFLRENFVLNFVDVASEAKIALMAQNVADGIARLHAKNWR